MKIYHKEDLATNNTNSTNGKNKGDSYNSCYSWLVLFNRFLNFPSLSLSHARQFSTAFSRSARELAGRKSSQVEVASRRHISAKKRVGRSSDESVSINSSIDFSDISRLLSTNSFRFITISKISAARFRPARRRWPKRKIQSLLLTWRACRFQK